MYECEIRKQAKNCTCSILHILWHLAKINNVVNLQTIKVGEKILRGVKLSKYYKISLGKSTPSIHQLKNKKHFEPSAKGCSQSCAKAHDAFNSMQLCLGILNSSRWSSGSTLISTANMRKH